MGRDDIPPATSGITFDDAGVGIGYNKNSECGAQCQENGEICMFAKGNERFRRPVR